MEKKFWFRIGFVLGILLLLSSFGTAQVVKKPIELRWAVNFEISTLDPNESKTDWDYMVHVNAYDTLIYPDSEKGYIPWIADSWKVSPEGLKYTFHLKKGIPFHDGKEITAEDVRFSMDRILTVPCALAPHFTLSLKPGTTKVLDKYTVEFNLFKRDPSFLDSLLIFKILNKELVLKNKAEGSYGEFGDYGVKFLATHDAGSGPFAVDEFKFGNFLRMKRFEAYPFRKRRPGSIDLVNILIIPEVVTISAKLKMGELDMCTWSVGDQFLTKLKEDKNFVIEEYFIPTPWTVLMNCKKKPLDDIHVRKAIAQAYDYEQVTTKILSGGKLMKGPLPEAIRGDCTDIKAYPFDLEKAKAKLAKSKYSAAELKQTPIEIAAVYGSERFQNICLLLATNMQKIGLNAQIKSVRIVDINQAAAKPETCYHLVLHVQGGRVINPPAILVYYTKEGWGTAWLGAGNYYDNPKATDAFNKAKDSLDANEQRKYYCEAQRLISEDCPRIWSHETFRQIPCWRYVKGFEVPKWGALFYELRFENFYMDTEDPLFKKNHGW